MVILVALDPMYIPIFGTTDIPTEYKNSDSYISKCRFYPSLDLASHLRPRAVDCGENDASHLIRY